MENFNLKRFLTENKLTTNSKTLNEETNSEFSTILAKLSQMAEKGEIELDDIRIVEQVLMSARRKGQQAIRQSQPDYQDRRAASIQKGKETTASFKEVEQLKAQVAQKFGITNNEMFGLIFNTDMDKLRPDLKIRVEKAAKFWNNNILRDLKDKYPTVPERQLRFA